MAMQIHLEAQLPVPQVSAMGSRPDGDLPPFARHIALCPQHLHCFGKALRAHRYVQVAGRPEGRDGIIIPGERVALEQEWCHPVPLQRQRHLSELLFQHDETDQALAIVLLHLLPKRGWNLGAATQQRQEAGDTAVDMAGGRQLGQLQGGRAQRA